MKLSLSKVILFFIIAFSQMFVCLAQSSQTEVDSTLNISDKKLKILEQPSPKMLGECRKAHFQGTITLRVEFQTNSEIGKIQPVTKMPYVMECVVKAVKKIKFEPEIKDGMAITVFKGLQYTFDWEFGWRNLLNKPVYVSSVFYNEISSKNFDNSTYYKDECKIVLRVEFPASGKLGEVKLVNNSCNDKSLEQRAFTEINKIDFLPALENGKLITTSKTIEFIYKILDDEDK